MLVRRKLWILYPILVNSAWKYQHLEQPHLVIILVLTCYTNLGAAPPFAATVPWQHTSCFLYLSWHDILTYLEHCVLSSASFFYRSTPDFLICILRESCNFLINRADCVQRSGLGFYWRRERAISKCYIACRQ